MKDIVKNMWNGILNEEKPELTNETKKFEVKFSNKEDEEVVKEYTKANDEKHSDWTANAKALEESNEEEAEEDAEDSKEGIKETMKLNEAIEEVEANLIRYRHEAETGMRFSSGKEMSTKQIERRKSSIPELEEKLEVLMKWNNHKQRGDSLILPIERELVAMYDLDVSEFTTPVMR